MRINNTDKNIVYCIITLYIMISYLMTNHNANNCSQIKLFLPNTTSDLSLNLSSTERHLSSDSSTGLSLYFRSSIDSIFTLDQEEYLEVNCHSDCEEKVSDKIPISIAHTRVREQTYEETQTKSPTPTKYYKILEENRKIVDEFTHKS